MSLLLAALLISGLASAAAGVTSSVLQKNAQDEANRTNIELQKMANESNIEQTKLANEAQLQQVQMANEFNAAEAQKQREWETEMSNTAIQREMADYSAAGLNPILAVPGGASVMSGASASANVANVKAAHVDAARVAPSSLDLNSIASAVQSMTNFMLTAKLLGTKEGQLDVSRGRLDVSRNFADSYSKQVASRNAANTSRAVLNNELALNAAYFRNKARFGKVWDRYR